MNAKLKGEPDGHQNILLAQIKYKLGMYPEATAHYLRALDAGVVSEHDQNDFITNILACSANDVTQADTVEETLNKMGHESASSSVYELFFNQSQSLLKCQLFEDAIKSFLKAHEVAVGENSFSSDHGRFLVQELHTLNSFYNGFNAIEYAKQSRFSLPKHLAHNNLVEVNMHALQDTYELNRAQFKELVGSLNWRKFAARILEQLKQDTKQNFTIEQQNLMEVNAIVALLRSHQFEQAREQWEKTAKRTMTPALRGIGAYFYLKVKKYEEALKLIESSDDTFSVFLRAHILLATKRSKDAIAHLIEASSK